MTDPRLQQQLDFIREADKVKNIFRQTYLMDGSRNENDAEHSWHLALMAMLLCETATEKLDLLRVIKMVLIHDLVEIDAGDVCVYDTDARAAKADLELAAAERIFNMLPPDQAVEIRSLWDEFEARQTPEAKFAAALDRVQPLMHNYATQGRAWKQHHVTREMSLKLNAHIAEGAPALWEFVQALLRDAEEKGYFAQE